MKKIIISVIISMILICTAYGIQRNLDFCDDRVVVVLESSISEQSA